MRTVLALATLLFVALPAVAEDKANAPATGSKDQSAAKQESPSAPVASAPKDDKASDQSKAGETKSAEQKK